MKTEKQIRKKLKEIYLVDWKIKGKTVSTIQ